MTTAGFCLILLSGHLTPLDGGKIADVGKGVGTAFRGPATACRPVGARLAHNSLTGRPPFDI